MSALAERPLAARWLYALKPASWPKLLIPCALGQLLGAAAGGPPNLPALVIGAVFTWSGLIFIVLLNDWGDREVDRIKRTMFPDGCSPKTIPDGVLPSAALLQGAVVAGAVALAAAFLGAEWVQRPLLGAAGVVGMLTFCAYTLPPLRLNYRGGGELLEMAGVGLLLPWFNAYVQSGQLWPRPLWVLPGFAVLALSSALASTLSDEQSDREGGKTTSATVFGNGVTRAAIDALVPSSCLVWVGSAALVAGTRGVVLALPACVLVVWHYRAQRAMSPLATTGAFAAQARYKGHLHRGIVRGGLWIAAAAFALEHLA